MRVLPLALALAILLDVAPAGAEEKEVPRVGRVVVTGTAGQLLSLMIAAFHRPPLAPPARLEGWRALPTELPRPTVATVCKVLF